MSLNAKKIVDNLESMMVLGTDILTENDLDLMEKKIETSFERPEGAIYYIKDLNLYPDKFSKYSNDFKSVAKEAHLRGYVWLMFDCDQETQFVPK